MNAPNVFVAKSGNCPGCGNPALVPEKYGKCFTCVRKGKNGK